MDLQGYKKSNDFLNLIYNHVTSALFIADEDARIYHFNDTFRTLFPKEEDRIIGELCGNATGCMFQVTQQVDCGETTECPFCNLRNSVIKTIKEEESVFRESLNREFLIQGEAIQKDLLFSTRPISFNDKKMVLIVVDDVTHLEEQKRKINQTNKNLFRALKTQTRNLSLINIKKENLTQELHHRMGNILQIISSLISLKKLETGGQKEQIDIQGYISNIRLLYDHISYNGDNPTVKTRNYFQDLTAYIQQACPNIIIEAQSEVFQLSMDIALPLGLLIQLLFTSEKIPGNIPFTVKLTNTAQGMELGISSPLVREAFMASHLRNDMEILLMDSLLDQLKEKVHLNYYQQESLTFLQKDQHIKGENT